MTKSVKLKYFGLIFLAIVFSKVNAQDKWTQKSDFRGKQRYSGLGFSVGNKGYMGLGYDSIMLKKDFWEYDSGIDTWKEKANFGGGLRAGVVSFSIGHKG